MVQVAYAIGVTNPVSLNVDTYGSAKVKDKKGNILPDGEISKIMEELFDMRPYAIIQRFGLKNPIFLPTASYGHFGRDYSVREVEVYYKVPDCKPIAVNGNGKKVYMKKVEFFAWEKLDYIEKIRKAFLL